MGGSESRRAARSGAVKPRVEEKPRTPAGDLKSKSRDALRALAKQLGLTGVSKLTKDALLARVEEAMQAAAAPARAPAQAGVPAPAAPVRAAPARQPASTPAGPGRIAVAPAQTAPAQTAPAQTAPAQTAPAQTAPVRTAPSQTTPGQIPPSVEEREPEAPAPGDADAAGEPAATAKLDLGPAAAAAEKPTEHIPWSYGQDRVTAAAIDPQRLYVYWEVTDPAVAQARAGLGEGGAGAWLNLRVYDTTGRIFDGTNAHAYFDHGLSRDDRQWFFHIGKPTSTAYVEIGMKSAAGHFVRIARSGRVDFPRAEPVPPDAAEWLTVRVSTGEAQPAGRGGGPAPVRPGGSPPPQGAIPVFDLGGADGQSGLERRIWELLHGDGRRIEWQQLLGGAGWFELEGHLDWEGPVLVTSWEAGPFTHPVSVEPPSREEWQGQSFAFRVGDVTHVVYGPWRVVIRNLGAFSERAEIARWEVFRSWVATGGGEAVVTGRPAAATRPGGASEALGASERRWLAGSELRLGGASEVFRMGASELRMRGASETLFAGASQWVKRGASERRLGGASEVRLRGGSELRLGGASEQRVGGASEGRLGGGSEDRLGGSEHRLAPEGQGTSLGYPKVEG